REPSGVCLLRGRLQVANQIREGYAYLILIGDQALRISTGGVDSQGRFELTTRVPGRYRLVINAGPEHHEYRLVTDIRTLSEGMTSWERTLTINEWKENGTRLDQE